MSATTGETSLNTSEEIPPIIGRIYKLRFSIRQVFGVSEEPESEPSLSSKSSSTSQSKSSTSSLSKKKTSLQ
jgi:hypothetical protein